MGHKSFVVSVGADQVGFGKAILEFVHQLIWVVAEKNGGHSLLARRDQDGAERCFTDSKTNFLVGATGAILGRRHAEHAGGFLVKGAAGVKAGVVDRLRDAGTTCQAFPDLRCAIGHRIILGRQTRGRLEAAMEIARTPADRCGQIGQRRLLLACLDQPTGTRDDGDVLRLNRRSVRIAALARSKPRRLGLLEGVMKQDVLGIGDPRRAGWPAVNAGCQNRVPKMTISRPVAGDDARPARIIGYDSLVLPLVLLVDHGHVCSHRLFV